MRYNNYDEWVEDINERYSESKKATTKVGLKQWFDGLDNNNIKADICRLSKMTYVGRSGNLCEDIILTAWAQAFYPNFYNSENDIVIKGDRRHETDFNVSRKYGKILRGYFNGTISMPLKIPNGEDSNEPYYWVIICSALQRRYSIFGSLDDLNKFIFTVSDMKICGELQNYGLYVRDINELCLAYAILHGYSLGDEINLLQSADEIIKSEQANILSEARAAENTYTKIAKDSFKDFLTAPFVQNDDENFLAAVKANAKVFIKNDTEAKTVQHNHWSSLKKLLEIRNSIYRDRKSIGRDFESRIESIIRLYKSLIGEDALSMDCSESELRAFLLGCLAVDDMQIITEWTDTWLNDYSNLGIQMDNINYHYRQNDLFKQKYGSIIEWYLHTIAGFKADLRALEMKIINTKDEQQQKKLKAEEKKIEVAMKDYKKALRENYVDKIKDRQSKIKKAEDSVEEINKDMQDALMEIDIAIADIIRAHMRYICIYATIKDIQEEAKTAAYALKLVNDNLRAAGFREIEDFEIDGVGEVTANDSPCDWFDWFVVQTIIFEEKQNNDFVSGYETFMDYVFGS